MSLCESHDEIGEDDISTLLDKAESHKLSWETAGVSPEKYAINVPIELFQLDATACVRMCLESPEIHGAATSPHEYGVMVVNAIPHLMAAYNSRKDLRTWIDDEIGIFIDICTHYVSGQDSVQPLKSEVRSPIR
jgi:hypothetical protein